MGRAFKARCTHAINALRDNPRVIRNDKELDGIRQYVADNPAQWADDENHPAQNVGAQFIAT
jgi:hypothetical protein